jgi:hypothetical protein
MKKLLLFLSLTTLPLSLLLAQQPWQMAHGSAQRRGYANIKGPQTSHIKWKYNMGYSPGEGENSIAINNTGIVYVGGHNSIYAFNRSGAFKWSQPYPGIQGPCASKDGLHVYFVADSAIVCLDTNGVKQWAYIMGDKGIFGPTLSADGNYLFQGCWDHNVYAITSTGTLKWKYPTHGCVSYNMALTPGGSLVVGGGDAHCGTDTLMYCIGNTETSSPITLWTYQGPFSHWSGPAIGRNGLIYIPMSPRLYVFDTLGNFKWSIGGPANVAGVITPGLYGDTTAASTTIYTGDFQGRFFSISGTTQDTTWAYQTGKDPITKNSGIPCFPVVDKLGDVYFGAADYNVYALNKSGTKLWSYATGGEITEASPAIDPETGTLYVTSGDGYVYAFQDSATGTGIQQLLSQNIEIRIMPNPAKNTFSITSDNDFPIGTVINLYSITGQMISNMSILGSTKRTDISVVNMPAGVYTIKIKLPDDSVINKKVEVIK